MNHPIGSQGSLSDSIDGKQYSAPSTSINFTGNLLLLKGRNFGSDEHLTIHIANYDKAVTKYSLDEFSNTVDYGGDKGGIKSKTGEFEIQSTGDKSAKGSFHCENGEGKKITNGSFDVRWD